MIKKYFALSLITASLLAAGCSDDDDDDGGATTDGMTTDGTTTDGTTTTGTTTTGTTTTGTTTTGTTTDGMTTDGETTDGAGGETATVVDEDAPAAVADDTSAYDVIAASDEHTTLAGLLEDADLANTLDAGEFTIFAPTDTAFEEFFTASGLTEETLSADAGLEGILTYHVLAGSQDLTTISTGITDAGTDDSFTLPVITAGVENSLTFETTTTGASGGIDVVDSIDARAGLADPLTGGSATPSGLVYSIDTVLTAPADDVETGGETVGTTTDGGTTDGPTTGGGVAGPVQTALEGGDFEAVSAALDGFLIKLDQETDNDPFTVLAVTDAGLAGMAIVLDDITGSGAGNGGLSPEELQEAGSITLRNTVTYAVGGTAGEDDLTIGGVPATLIGGNASTTYRLEAFPTQ